MGDNLLHSSKTQDGDDSVTDTEWSTLNLINQASFTITGCECNTVHSSQGFEVVLISDLWNVTNFVRVMISGEKKKVGAGGGG